MTNPPLQPDVRRQLKARLLELSPRAFELFAGDLLTYIGLRRVEVTRYSGDGGVDAHGDLTSESGLVCVPTGVQVKRHRSNVQRADIDRFIGALGGQYRHGIFITTAGYAEQARVKARTSPLLRVDTVAGDDVVALMRRHQLGLRASGAAPLLDEDYFLGFEAQAASGGRLREGRAAYAAGADAQAGAIARPEDDLISLRALSYALRVDLYTARDWIDRGRLQPDRHTQQGRREIFFFRRDRVDAIHQQLMGAARPQTSVEWRQEFLDFAKSRSMVKSYKPVMLSAMLRLVSRDGEVRLDDLAAEFLAFYVGRQRAGLPAEFGATLMERPSAADDEAIKRLIVKNPLERFIIKGFLSYDAAAGVIRFAPQLWAELRFYELLDIQRSVDEQIRYYYARHGA
jgi:hypothetical protein